MGLLGLLLKEFPFFRPLHLEFCCSDLFKTFELEDNLEYFFSLEFESQLAMNQTILGFDLVNTLDFDSFVSNGLRFFAFLASGFE
jgi:hypothetical protein